VDDMTADPNADHQVRMTHGDRPTVAGLPLRWQVMRAPRRDGKVGERAVGLWVVDGELDALVAGLTQEEFVRSDERMPYFGAIWPAAEALVARVLGGPRLDGQHVLDLGCGLGACGFAAAARGARVTFLDWEPRALAIVAASARRQGQPPGTFDFVVADWRQPPPCGPFDLILGADVLYEERNVAPVATFVGEHWRPGGEVWLADPGRPHARGFRVLAERQGLAWLGSEVLPTPGDQGEITLLRVGRAR
jgi:2-polyprenyl-3-methyl-5-hydroxy-6-metoxy-1,4-benzoquinol methylase